MSKNVSKIACLFFYTSVSCAAVAPSYFSVTLHVVNNIFRPRPYQSYASFLLLLPWTAQLLVTTHTPSNWYGANSCFCQRRCRGVREKNEISGEPWSLFFLYSRQRCLFLSVFYTLFPLLLLNWKLIWSAALCLCIAPVLPVRCYSLPIWLVMTWQACTEHNKHSNWSTRWSFNAFVDLFCHLVYNLIWLRGLIDLRCVIAHNNSLSKKVKFSLGGYTTHRSIKKWSTEI